MTSNKQISKGKEGNNISIMHTHLIQGEQEIYWYFEKGIIPFIAQQSLYIKSIQGWHFTYNGLTKK